jgi:hypothetical protein
MVDIVILDSQKSPRPGVEIVEVGHVLQSCQAGVFGLYGSELCFTVLEARHHLGKAIAFVG